MGEACDQYSINCWSGPRCCSTSLMYSFAQRDDTQVLDEPLYANYLKLSGVDRPYLQQVFDSQSSDGNAVVQQQLLGPRASKVLYAKHISKHKIGLHPQIWKRAQHMILVREPYAVVQSFSKVLAPTAQELGYTALLEILSELQALGRQPVVILSDELVRQPEGMLRAACAALGLPFQEAMLSWAAGPKPYDGVWAPWWYANTHKGTGFEVSVREAREPLPEHLKPCLAQSYPIYELLRRYALKPVSADAVPRPLPPADSQQDGQQQAAAEPATPAGAAAAGAAAAGAAAGNEKVGTHVYKPDPRNADVLVGIRDGVTGSFELVWRPQAKVSVLDSGFMLGDGVWEGIRVHRGVMAFAEQHLERLYEGAKALDMDLGLSRAQLAGLVYDTLDANGMHEATGVHIRLMVSRGLKPTPYQNPTTTIGQPTIVVLAEYKEAAPVPKEKGIKLFTVHVRRGAADVQDPMWNSHSKLNCIAACIQANKAGADEGLMLDPHGFVATCNSTNFFVVRKGTVWAPTTKYQLHGITRANIIRLCKQQYIPVREADFSLTQVYSADEAFVTGTFAGLIPVREVDGRVVGSGERGPLTQRLQQMYLELMEEDVAQGRAV